MILDANFEQRLSDVDAHFRCLEFIDGIESYKHKPIVDKNNGRELYVDQQMQCCIKAQTLLLLYNLVESTVCECLNYIYDNVADDGLTYSELTNEMRNMWNASCRKSNRPEKDMEEADKMSLLVVFNSLSINTSGSIDIKKIYESFGKHGCIIADDKREEYGSSFLKVKNKRNLLAHGNVSFSQCGGLYLFSNLEKMRNDISSFLRIVLESTKKFVKEKNIREPKKNMC